MSPLVTIARIQKRIHDWSFTLNEGGVTSPIIRAKFEEALKNLQTAVTDIWRVKSTKEKEEDKNLSPDEEAHLRTLEGHLEALNEEARLYVQDNTPILKETTFRE